jgi:hypothetical protein
MEEPQKLRVCFTFINKTMYKTQTLLLIKIKKEVPTYISL